MGISEQTFHRWKKQYIGLGVDQARESSRLREENRRLKRPVAGLALDKAMPQDALKKGLNRDLAQLFRRDFVEASAVGAPLGNQFGGLASFWSGVSRSFRAAGRR